MGMRLRKSLRIGNIFFSVIGIEVQQDTARFQHTHPFAVGMLRIRQGPCQISGNDNVKRFIRKYRFFRVHNLEPAAGVFLLGKLDGILNHLRCQVDAEYLVALFCQQDREKSGSAADIKDF